MRPGNPSFVVASCHGAVSGCRGYSVSPPAVLVVVVMVALQAIPIATGMSSICFMVAQSYRKCIFMNS